MAVGPSGRAASEETAAKDAAKDAAPAVAGAVVGRCLGCSTAYDTLSGAHICNVCRDLVVYCPSCREQRPELHCETHMAMQHCFFTFLERFDVDALRSQLVGLQGLVADLDEAARRKQPVGAMSGLRVSKNIRRTLVKQQQRVEARVAAIETGAAVADPAAPRRCRQCSNPSTVCNGYCWGIWRDVVPATEAPNADGALSSDGNPRKRKAASVLCAGEEEGEGREEMTPILPVAVGDRVFRRRGGERSSVGGAGAEISWDSGLGTVVEVKRWSATSTVADAVRVTWDSAKEGGGRQAARDGTVLCRWGVVGLQGRRIYDVEQVETQKGAEMTAPVVRIPS